MNRMKREVMFVRISNCLVIHILISVRSTHLWTVFVALERRISLSLIINYYPGWICGDFSSPGYTTMNKYFFFFRTTEKHIYRTCGAQLVFFFIYRFYFDILNITFFRSWKCYFTFSSHLWTSGNTTEYKAKCPGYV